MSRFNEIGALAHEPVAVATPAERLSSILAGLTPRQAEAAALTGAVLVLAGAGTGKTRTLTAGVAARIAARGIPPSRILAVTFTNKAAKEMADRIRTMLAGEGVPSWVGIPSRPRCAAAPDRAGGRRATPRLRHPGRR